MRNLFSIIILLYLNINIVAAIQPTQKGNYKNIDRTILNEVEDFNFVFSRNGWRYSTFDSTFVDYNNIIRDTIYIDGEQFIKTKLLQKKIVFTNNEKLKIYRVV